MNEQLEAYIEKQKETERLLKEEQDKKEYSAEKKRREKMLIEAGLVEKGGSYLNGLKAIELSDEEFAEFEKYYIKPDAKPQEHKDKPVITFSEENNKIGVVFTVLGWIILETILNIV